MVSLTLTLGLLGTKTSPPCPTLTVVVAALADSILDKHRKIAVAAAIGRILQKKSLRIRRCDEPGRDLFRRPCYKIVTPGGRFIQSSSKGSNEWYGWC